MQMSNGLIERLGGLRDLVLAASLAAIGIALVATPDAKALSRIKDLAAIEGVRENQLVGYGLVTGLNGTGDTLNNCPMTRQSMQAMMERLGVNTRGANIRTANIAAVMVTANLPAFSTQGTRLDVTVSALCDSKSLQGATLLATLCWVPMARSTPWHRARSPFPVSRPKARLQR